MAEQINFTRKGSGTIITRIGGGSMGDQGADQVPDDVKGRPTPNWVLKFLYPNLPPGETINWNEP